jgi:hypothetical protein
VWCKYDVEINNWPEDKYKIDAYLKDKLVRKYWENIFNDVKDGRIDTWDYQLVFCLLKDRGKCIVPRLNLVSNIGFGPDATHTVGNDSFSAFRDSYDFTFPIRGEKDPDIEEAIGKYLEMKIFSKKTLAERLANALKYFSNIFIGNKSLDLIN